MAVPSIAQLFVEPVRDAVCDFGGVGAIGADFGKFGYEPGPDLTANERTRADCQCRLPGARMNGRSPVTK